MAKNLVRNQKVPSENDTGDALKKAKKIKCAVKRRKCWGKKRGIDRLRAPYNG